MPKPGVKQYCTFIFSFEFVWKRLPMLCCSVSSGRYYTRQKNQQIKNACVYPYVCSSRFRSVATKTIYSRFDEIFIGGQNRFPRSQAAFGTVSGSSIEWMYNGSEHVF